MLEVSLVINGHEKAISLLLARQEAMLQTFLNFVPIKHQNEVRYGFMGVYLLNIVWLT
jgi:hypothetical protein|tara:strand:+ start:1143 stop:1316 length:174 start_codon:yes stop_codon:yes gene_type:complete